MAGDKTYEGDVFRVIYDKNNFSIFVISVVEDGKHNEITVKGNAVNLFEGQKVKVTGNFVKDQKFGWQFKAHTIIGMRPTSTYDIAEYLRKCVKGITNNLAIKIVDKFGTDTYSILDNEPQRLLEIKGIGQSRVDKIIVSWAAQKAYQEVKTYLSHGNLGAARIDAIYKHFLQDTIKIVEENKYAIMDVKGIGFLIADTFALSMGVPMNAVERIVAAVDFEIDEAGDEGHTYLLLGEAVDNTSKRITVPRDEIHKIIETYPHKFIIEKFNGNTVLFSRKSYKAETIVGMKIGLLLQTPPEFTSYEFEDDTLTDEQNMAVRNAMTNRISVITGGPGTGKSHITKALIKKITASGSSYVLCAPTGRAAKVMKEYTGSNDAFTIHRLLGLFPKGTKSDDIDDENMARSISLSSYKYIIVDEFSMVDAWLASQLFGRMKETQNIILIGDVDQLPSIGPGNILRDIIDSGVVKTTKLTKIFRQAEKSEIIKSAHAVNNGRIITTSVNEENSDLFFIDIADGTKQTVDYFGYVLDKMVEKRGLRLKDIQVLCPMKDRFGVNAINEFMQRKYNKSTEIYKHYSKLFKNGDRVMQIKNNYNKGVFNGDVGYISSVYPNEKMIIVDYGSRFVEYRDSDINEITLAYAVTIHKSQGSQYKAVVIVMTQSHYIMLQRNLLYTAITRAKDFCLLLSDPKAVAMAVNNNKIAHRNTALIEFINNPRSKAIEYMGYLEQPIEEEKEETYGDQFDSAF